MIFSRSEYGWLNFNRFAKVWVRFFREGIIAKKKKIPIFDMKIGYPVENLQNAVYCFVK